MKRGTPRHPKLAALSMALGIKRWGAVGILEMLWHFTAEFAHAGDVGRFDDASIALALCWDGDSAELVSSLVRTGWLDRCRCHRLRVHDWPSHADQTVTRVLAKRNQQFIACYDDPSTILARDEHKTSQPLPLPSPLPSPIPEPSPSPEPLPTDCAALAVRDEVEPPHPAELIFEDRKRQTSAEKACRVLVELWNGLFGTRLRTEGTTYDELVRNFVRRCQGGQARGQEWAPCQPGEILEAAVIAYCTGREFWRKQSPEVLLRTGAFGKTSGNGATTGGTNHVRELLTKPQTQTVALPGSSLAVVAELGILGELQALGVVIP